MQNFAAIGPLGLNRLKYYIIYIFATVYFDNRFFFLNKSKYNNRAKCLFIVHFLFLLFHQTKSVPQECNPSAHLSAPMADYSCSPHNDSGVEMNAAGGSLGDLTALDDDRLIQDAQISSNVGDTGDGGGVQGGAGRQGRGSVTVTTAPMVAGRTTSPFTEKSLKNKVRVSATGSRLAQKIKTAVPILPQMPQPPPQIQTQLPPVINNNNCKCILDTKPCLNKICPIINLMKVRLMLQSNIIACF